MEDDFEVISEEFVDGGLPFFRVTKAQRLIGDFQDAELLLLKRLNLWTEILTRTMSTGTPVAL